MIKKRKAGLGPLSYTLVNDGITPGANNNDFTFSAKLAGKSGNEIVNLSKQPEHLFDGFSGVLQNFTLTNLHVSDRAQTNAAGLTLTSENAEFSGLSVLNPVLFAGNGAAIFTSDILGRVSFNRNTVFDVDATPTVTLSSGADAIGILAARAKSGPLVITNNTITAYFKYPRSGFGSNDIGGMIGSVFTDLSANKAITIQDNYVHIIIELPPLEPGLRQPECIGGLLGSVGRKVTLRRNLVNIEFRGGDGQYKKYFPFVGCLQAGIEGKSNAYRTNGADQKKFGQNLNSFPSESAAMTALKKAGFTEKNGWVENRFELLKEHFSTKKGKQDGPGTYELNRDQFEGLILNAAIEHAQRNPETLIAQGILVRVEDGSGDDGDN